MTDKRLNEAETREALERHIDAWTLRVVVEMLAEICDEKAEHTRVAWGDHDTARAWWRNARALNRVAGNL